MRTAVHFSSPNPHHGDNVDTDAQKEVSAHKHPNDHVESGSPPGTRPRPDFHLFSDVPNPTIWLLSPISKNACSWIADHISDDAMWFGSSLVVEHRYCAALIAQIERDGLRVGVSR